MNEDRDLRDAFRQLRETESTLVPRFEIRQRERRGIAPLIAGIAAILIIIIVMVSSRRSIERPDISAWRAPTDFLLRTPGKDLTSSVPDIRPEIPTVKKGDQS